MSWRPEPFWELLDRYLVTAHLLGASAVIVMNKSDLADEFASDKQLQNLAEYEQVGYPVINTVADAALSGDSNSNKKNGLFELQKKLDGKVNVLVGQSGVGKSSLATLLLPDIEIVVGEISNSGEGRHTTTTTTLYNLPLGGS